MTSAITWPFPIRRQHRITIDGGINAFLSVLGWYWVSQVAADLGRCAPCLPAVQKFQKQFLEKLRYPGCDYLGALVLTMVGSTVSDPRRNSPSLIFPLGET